MKIFKKAEIHFLQILIICFSILTACSSDDDETSPEPPPAGEQTDIYLTAADESGDMYLWKNGEKMNKLDGINPFSMLIKNNDIHLAGNNGLHDPAYWKNGALTHLPLSGGSYPNESVTGMTIMNDNIYISATNWFAGSKIWKNGSIFKLFPESEFAELNGISSYNSTLYAAGIYYESALTHGRLWKQTPSGEEFIELPDFDKVISMTVSDNDVYVLGKKNSIIRYWKNGIVKNLTDGTEVFSDAYCITVVDGNVYVGGSLISTSSNMQSVYWKNGNLVKLGDAEFVDAGIRSISILNNDVYAAGFQRSFSEADYTSVLWTNGVEKSFGKGYATGVFAKIR